MTRVRLEVDGLEGGHDARRLREGLASLPAVVAASVDVDGGLALVDVEAPLAEVANDLREAVAKLGYRMVGLEGV